MPDRLEPILAEARRRIAGLHARRRELERRAGERPPPPPFGIGLRGASVGVLAEVKRRSPSAGAIREDLDPVAHARGYTAGGAVAVSVLTEESRFGGSLGDLEAVAQAVPVPVLRKDFILDALQLVEARAAGAAAVLLIARALDAAPLAALAAEARALGLATLVEVHAESELERALAAGPTAVGVNSRDLSTFETDFSVIERVLPRVPREVLAVAESGIAARTDVERLAATGADLVLVGTSVAAAPDPAAAVRALVGVPRRER